MDVKTCTKCGEEKPLEAFKVDRSTLSGHKQPCKRCSNLHVKVWEKNNPERAREINIGVWKRRAAKVSNYNKTRRAELLEAYGNRCVCCGETTPEFLTIDHIYNDGAAHRREIGKRSCRLYSWLKANGFPKDRFQLLCWNCNSAKGFYGECPHVRAKRR